MENLSVYIISAVNLLFSSGAIIAFIAWLRYRKKDKAETVNVEATTGKIIAETKQIAAETEINLGAAWKLFGESMSQELIRVKRDLEDKLELVSNKLDQCLLDNAKILTAHQKEIDELKIQMVKNGRPK